jgi:carbon-monoxide dehydrogenase small subunit
MHTPSITRRWHVNGAERAVTFDASARLLDVLREQLGLTGSKEGCGEGECGACSVVVNGLLKLSCLQLAAAVPDGTSITTIEGIAASPSGRHLQQLMLERGGVQCGFCTPGIVVAAWWYVEQRPPIDVRAAMAGNLCRCTGYQGIVAAVKEAAEQAVAPGGGVRP